MKKTTAAKTDDNIVIGLIATLPFWALSMSASDHGVAIISSLLAVYYPFSISALYVLDRWMQSKD